MEDKDAFESKDTPEELKLMSAEAILELIQDALDDISDEPEEFTNEFGDPTIAISLNGNQEALDNAMKQQELYQYLRDAAQAAIAFMQPENKDEIVCCFTGHRPKKIPWLADDEDLRTKRLKRTLGEFINGLSLGGVTRYIAGNADGFDTIAAEMVLESNRYLEFSKEWEGVPEGWEAPKLEIAIPFEGHNSNNERIMDIQNKAAVAHVVSSNKNRAQAFFERNEYMVDHTDIVIALIDEDEKISKKGGTYRTIEYAAQQDKPVFEFNANWFEDGWPSANGVSVILPSYIKKILDEHTRAVVLGTDDKPS